MRYSIFAAFAAITLVCASGCGDDDGGGTPTDGGTTDTGTTTDAGPRDSGPRDSGEPRDTGAPDTGAPLPVPECDPYTAGSCPDGQKCSAVLIPATDTTEAVLWFGCVPGAMARAEGVTCDRWNRDATPDVGSDEVLTDDCRQGLFCWDDPTRPTFSACRKMCDGEQDLCAAGSYCMGLNSDPYFGVCEPADGCDPVAQTGCAAGQGCYVVRGTNEDILGNCFTFTPEDGLTGAVGEPCMYIDTCQPGSQCFSERYPDGGVGDVYTCRTLCAAEDPDAGVACPDMQTCAAIPLEMGMLRVPTAPGSCQ